MATGLKDELAQDGNGPGAERTRLGASNYQKQQGGGVAFPANRPSSRFAVDHNAMLSQLDDLPKKTWVSGNEKICPGVELDEVGSHLHLSAPRP